jgi:hypothetical protein
VRSEEETKSVNYKLSVKEITLRTNRACSAQRSKRTPIELSRTSGKSVRGDQQAELLQEKFCGAVCFPLGCVLMEAIEAINEK